MAKIFTPDCRDCKWCDTQTNRIMKDREYDKCDNAYVSSDFCSVSRKSKSTDNCGVNGKFFVAKKTVYEYAVTKPPHLNKLQQFAVWLLDIPVAVETQLIPTSAYKNGDWMLDEVTQ